MVALGATAALAVVTSGMARAAQPTSTAPSQGGCGGVGTQLALVMLMLTLSCAVHAWVSALQVERIRSGRLARWYGPIPAAGCC